MSDGKLSYQKYKFKVKMWEKNFKKLHGRIPSKHDIREASRDIRDSYKMYYKLKTSFLEDTLSDVLSEDGFDILDSLQNESILSNDHFINLPPGVEELVNKDTNSIHLNSIAKSPNENQNAIVQSLAADQYSVIKEFHPVEDFELNKKAWGKSVSQIETKADPVPEKQTKPTKNVFNAKFFSAGSFSKRNPRKSLSRLASSTSVKSDSSTGTNLGEMFASQEILPDLETILSQKSQQKSQDEPIPLIPKLSKDLLIDVDKKWLDRCDSKQDHNATSCSVQNEEVKRFGLSNFNLKNNNLARDAATNDDCRNISQQYDDGSDSVVSNSEDEMTTQRIRHLAKRRKISQEVDSSNLKNEQKANTSEPLVEHNRQTLPLSVEEPKLKKNARKPNKKQDKKIKTSIKTENNDTVTSKRLSRKKKEVSYCESKSSDEDSKDPTNSFSEEENISAKLSSKTKSPRKLKNGSSTTEKTKGKKRAAKMNVDDEVDESNDDAEAEYSSYLDLGNLKSLPRVNVEELLNAENVLDKIENATKVSSIKPVVVDYNTKLAEDKLKAKIATGKLNENYLRLNMKKKLFLKGKKKFNYSKYKKSMWMQKKESALCGPDMDMRGCDGGILTCFKCGQPGHFAQNCKTQGDKLLPLEADVDESPFPTLQEAENMAMMKASQSACNKINNMPIVSNTLLYKDFQSETTDADERTSSDEDCLGEKVPNSEVNEYKTNAVPKKAYVGHKIPEDFLKKSGLLEGDSKKREVEPLYQTKEDGSVLEVTTEVTEALHLFGHQSFRKGQDKAVMRILSGLSTLVTLSTGSGKSLCYQLPAYLFSRMRGAITLVISPLVSLMEDQVHGVPAFIRAHCLHTNQTPQQRLKVLELVNKGEVDVLLVSPEAVVAGERSTGFGSTLRNLPPIAFACIDEAHCVSQWSHNFRPSYLMICKVLRQKLGIKVLLGLTATATFNTRESIVRHLGISDGMDGIISDIPLPDNLILSVSMDFNRDAALIKLLRSERYSSLSSIIIYCTTRNECERLSGFIRTCLQDQKPEESSSKKRKRVNWNAEAYHAGMPAYRRRTIQKAFMGNQLRIVVATIAFGMGINKSDIRAVIHYNMPKNFESYVQEVGRAGRDGKTSYCHLFLNSQSSDQVELRRHIYANSIDRHVIRKLLKKVFIPCACENNFNNVEFVKEHAEEIKAANCINWDVDFEDDAAPTVLKNQKKCPGHEIGFPTEKTVQELDIPAENITTLLCYLELESKWRLEIMSNAYIMAKVMSYGGSKYLKQAARECPPLAMAIAMEFKKGDFNVQNNIIEFSVIDIASAIGWNSGVVKHQLKNLEWTTVDDMPKRSPISVTFYNLGFRLRAPGDFTDDELDEALDYLYKRSIQQEKTQLLQLQFVFEGLSSVAHETCNPCCVEKMSNDNSDKLKLIIREYFKTDYSKSVELREIVDDTPDESIISDVKSMINMYPENTFTGRTLARIFHGIQSPNFPAVIWGKCKYWRAYITSDFNRLVRLANYTIVKLRS